MSDRGLKYYEQYLQGQENAVEGLVRTYSDGLIRFAYCYVGDPEEAEDIMEDAIVALILKQKRLYDESSLRRYLYKIARNKAITHLRRRRGDVPLSDVVGVLASGDLETDYFRRARNITVCSCIQALPKQYQEVLHLTYFEGFETESKIVPRTYHSASAYTIYDII